LPLIKKIMALLLKTKVFTKINIWQIFYYLQIKKGQENLIIFRIKIGIFKY